MKQKKTRRLKTNINDSQRKYEIDSGDRIQQGLVSSIGREASSDIQEVLSSTLSRDSIFLFSVSSVLYLFINVIFDDDLKIMNNKTGNKITLKG